MFRNAAGAVIRPVWVVAADGQPGWTGHWSIARNHLTGVAEVIAIRDGSVEIEMHSSPPIDATGVVEGQGLRLHLHV